MQQIQASDTMFAAILDDDTVVTWGQQECLESGEDEEPDDLDEAAEEEERLEVSEEEDRVEGSEDEDYVDEARRAWAARN